MSRTTTIAYLVAAVLAIVALVALIARPMHWERTAVLAVVLAAVAAAVGATRPRRTA